MEDEGAPITIKVEVQEEILDDESIVTEQFAISEEHNYNKIMEEDFYYRLQVHHSIDIKEESEEIETENSCSDEITIQQQIEAEKQKDELIKSNGIANRDPTKLLSQQQKIKEEDLDIELGELHDTIDIKVENGFIESDPLQGEGTTTKYLTLEDFGEVKAQRMPISSRGKFLQQFIEISKQRNLVSQILKYYDE